MSPAINPKNQPLIKPRRLKKGDRVIVVSPSQPITSPKYFKRGLKTLESLGFRVETSKNVNTVYGMYKAGTPAERAADLNEAFARKDIKGVFMSVGGFLANQVLPLLDYKLIRQNPKVLIGFSDGTTLLNAIYRRSRLVTFHGFNIEYFFMKANSYTIKSFQNICSEGGTTFLRRSKWQVLKPGHVRGKLLGGNLISFANLLGTRYFPDISHSILFFEEHDDFSEDVESALTRLINAGIFAEGGAQGIIFGKMINVSVGSADKEIQQKFTRPKFFTLNTIIKELFKPYKIPIITNVDFGDIYYPMTIPLGVEAELDATNSQITFRLLEPAVR
ncbi:MAG: LD-carboxypeptidase [Candidatus Pacebacteria bacterium]|nr:LD-carboxypeptidase [Candidatus Paceibacterota bacterium]